MENKVQENSWADALGQIHRPHDGAARIVSLVPSLTELVCDLGLVGQLVGRTGFCIHPKETLKAVPKVGGTKDVNIARLRELEPTHVIVNIDENRRECVEEIAAFVPHVIVTHPCAPEDNLAVYRLFGGVFDRRDEAGRLEEALRQALEAARVVGEGMPRERVLYLIWREPWMTVARGTYISAALAAVGWDTWPPGEEPRYPAFDLNASWLREVGRVFLSSEPYRFRAGHLAEVELATGKPTSLIDGEMVSWYGSRAVAGMRYLAAMRRSLSGLE